MNTYQETFQTVTGATLAILANEPGKKWRMKALIEQIKTESDYTNGARIDVILRTIIAANLVNADWRGAECYIWNREGGGGSGAGSAGDSFEKDRMKTAFEAAREMLTRQINEQKLRAENAEAMLKETREAAKSMQGRIVEVQLKDGPKVVKRVTGIFHKKFHKVLVLAKARKNIFLYGPTGGGKSHLCEQIANSLGMTYSFVSCTTGMSEGVLAGRLLPVGKNAQFEYVMSEFVRAFEDGGLFFLDELDAADANVLLLINAALANGKMFVSNRKDKYYAVKHPDFVCIAAANTVGTGGDRMYAGRNKLDASTLDRFQAGKVHMDYDTDLERQLCDNDAFLNKCWRIRRAINDNRLERAMSTRFIVEGHDLMVNWEVPEEDLFVGREDGFFAGWREDEFNKVRSAAGL